MEELSKQLIPLYWLRHAQDASGDSGMQSLGVGPAHTNAIATNYSIHLRVPARHAAHTARSAGAARNVHGRLIAGDKRLTLRDR